MELDRTRIAIRERGLTDILDLSLRVTATFFVPLVAAAAAGVVPLMVLNWWLLGWMVSDQFVEPQIMRYLWLMAQLVFVQSQLGLAASTVYLGKKMFLQPSSPGIIWNEIRKSLPQLLWSQLGLRGVGLAVVMAGLIGPEEDVPAVSEVFLPILACYVVVVRCSRPFVNEIILLEQNPFRSRDPDVVTLPRRSSSLHGPNTADLFARWIVCAGVTVLLACSVFWSFWFLWGSLFFRWEWSPIMLHIVAPTVMWLVAVYLSVIRFLCYLDLRIRREGWEIGLILRAAAARVRHRIVT